MTLHRVEEIDLAQEEEFNREDPKLLELGFGDGVFEEDTEEYLRNVFMQEEVDEHPGIGSSPLYCNALSGWACW